MASRRFVLPGCVTGFFLVCFSLTFLILDGEHLAFSKRPAIPASDESALPADTVLQACPPAIPAGPEVPMALTDDSLSLEPIRRHNIAIGSAFPHHFDVYMTVAWTLERVLSYVPESQVYVFAEPFNYGFQSVVDRLGLYHGIRNSSSELLPFLNSAEGVHMDVVILGTCEVDLRAWHTDLLAVWDARPLSRKFQLVCIVHNVKDTSWQVHIGEWSRRGSIRLLPIANHVEAAFRHVFNQHADSTDTVLNTAGYESIPIDVHVPVLDLPSLPNKSPNRSLSKAVIQGTFDIGRRDYPALFIDIINSLHEDPSAWGYHSLENNRSFIPNHRSSVPPFELALVGAGRIEIPEELAYMVTVYHDLDYDDFYKLIAGMDIVVPAFADFGYYEDQASSTIALAVELDVPILATERMRKAYGYIDDDRVVITRPAAMREVHALKALRTRDASSFLQSDPTGSGHAMLEIRGIMGAVHNMITKGWSRDKQDTHAFKKELWDQNELVIRKLLTDL